MYFNLNNDEISKELLVNRISTILENQGRLGLNDEKTPSPHNEPQRSRGFVLWKKGFLKISQISQENICVGVSFRPAKTPTLVLSCEISEISKNNYFEKHCERLILFNSPQNTIPSSCDEFGLDEILTESNVTFIK